jgi:hypothetical protein
MILEIYKGADGFRWRKLATNGRVVEASSQGYVRYREVSANLRAVGLPCPVKWARRAVKVKRGTDRRWRWEFPAQAVA